MKLWLNTLPETRRFYWKLGFRDERWLDIELEGGEVYRLQGMVFEIGVRNRRRRCKLLRLILLTPKVSKRYPSSTTSVTAPFYSPKDIPSQ